MPECQCMKYVGIGWSSPLQICDSVPTTLFDTTSLHRDYLHDVPAWGSFDPRSSPHCLWRVWAYLFRVPTMKICGLDLGVVEDGWIKVVDCVELRVVVNADARPLHQTCQWNTPSDKHLQFQRFSANSKLSMFPFYNYIQQHKFYSYMPRTGIVWVPVDGPWICDY